MKRIGLMISVSLLVLTASLPSFQIAHAVEAKQKGSDTVSEAKWYAENATLSEGLKGYTDNSLSIQSQDILKPNIERSEDVVITDENGKVIGKLTSPKSIITPSLSTLATGRVATVGIKVDEEYRNKYWDWITRVRDIVEVADDAFNRDFNIDLSVKNIGYWMSSGNNDAELINELKGYGTNEYDFVIGFTSDSKMDTQGVAFQYNSPPPGEAFSLILDQNAARTANAVQHELSHNYGLGHDSIDPNSSYPICIMNYGTVYSTTQWHTEHKNLLSGRTHWYGVGP
ncbi:M12 family metallo-peptidase [Paenibacillus sp. UMB4589-SE434]|uniref:M12 family metallo-peptidase n=1 Tax=Paenibacillus sp. UMB4589-SE434 TaxID=3046314 RepID=UPI00254BB100|nr:M12 family metallo-peptidase [Paenibacillus sp. UMB4589-SE434]MDK8179391.1 M12 family metallo-peptidase [Paenibacillus sp. UMB4589-SE434]